MARDAFDLLRGAIRGRRCDRAQAGEAVEVVRDDRGELVVQLGRQLGGATLLVHLDAWRGEAEQMHVSTCRVHDLEAQDCSLAAQPARYAAPQVIFAADDADYADDTKVNRLSAP